MAFIDIIKKKIYRKAKEKSKRPSKGALLKPSVVALPEKPEKAVKKQSAQPAEVKSEIVSRVILAPHITERASIEAEKGVYIFRVSPRANKVMIRQSFRELYGFFPRKIGIINVPSKTRKTRGKIGIKSGYKKAAIYLNKGDKVEVA